MNSREAVTDVDVQARAETSSPAARPLGTRRNESSSADPVSFLQRTFGNQAVGKWFSSGALQPKLSIGKPNDVYEQEADRVADQVMRMPEKGALQAKDASGQMVSTQRNRELTGAVHKVLRSPGRPLDAGTRGFMEPRFGYDFSHVRIHTDANAAESARAVNAKAYTVGRDVAFGAGQYARGTSEGRKLIAHELTHVIQNQKTPSIHCLRRSAESDAARIDDGSPARPLARNALADP